MDAWRAGFEARLTEQADTVAGHNTALAAALEDQSRTARSLAESTRDFAAGLGRLRQDADRIPLEETARQLGDLNRETGELNAVVDSVIDLLDRKLEKVG